MCEPSHSIVQYPPEDNHGNPLGPKIEAVAGTKSLFKKLFG